MLSSLFFRRLFLPYLLLLCAATATIGFFGAVRLRSGYRQGMQSSLDREATVIWRLLARPLDAGDMATVNLLIHSQVLPEGGQLSLIGENGAVIADSEVDPASEENDWERPEISGARAFGEATSVRQSNTFKAQMFFLARREKTPEGKQFYLRMAVRLSEMEHELYQLYAEIAGVAAASLLVAVALYSSVARHHMEPVREVAAFADALARGELNRRFHPSGGGEIGLLSTSLNTMAESINQLLEQTTNDRAELSAILASMSEGVIATDTSQRILLANEKAAELLDFDADAAVGKVLWEVLRLEPILRAAGEALTGIERRAFPVSPNVSRHLEVTVRQFPLSGRPTGLVIVAHDTTRSVRYQELRKEFVANVSHELRTPLTVIKGFTETLQDGAMADPSKGVEFLGKISKHVDQLTNLVNDLLELSRLEGSPELPRPVKLDVSAVARRVTDLLLPAAQRKFQTVRIEAGNHVPRILGNPDYIDRAIANLVDNAIKYTHEGGTIWVTVGTIEGDVHVDVADNGLGIPPDDIPRIFERFYRVDRSRSREMGGTGLGLSIVKHVAQVHGGSIDVTSTPGSGSRFRLRFPIPGEVG